MAGNPVDRTGAGRRRDQGRTRPTWLDQLSARVSPEHDQVDVEFADQTGEQSLKLASRSLDGVDAGSNCAANVANHGEKRSSYCRVNESKLTHRGGSLSTRINSPIARCSSRQIISWVVVVSAGSVLSTRSTARSRPMSRGASATAFVLVSRSKRSRSKVPYRISVQPNN